MDREVGESGDLGFDQWTEGVKWGGRLGLVGWPSGVDGLLGRSPGGFFSFFFVFFLFILFDLL